VAATGLALDQAACRPEARTPIREKGRSHMPVVRISNGRFDAARVADVERFLRESEQALRGPLTKLPGLVHFYAGVDRARGFITNVSVWDSLEHARQLDTLQEMLAQRPVGVAAGVTFEPPITNHETVWTIIP
jgi:hypothetical protein